MTWRSSTRFLMMIVVGIGASAVPAAGGHPPQFDVNAFLDALDATDIGESTAYIPPNTMPPLPPIPPIVGPVTTGVVTGQFEIDCNDPVDPLTGCMTTAYFAQKLNWKWGLLNTTTMQFEHNTTGDSFFPSGFPDEGLTMVDATPNSPQRFLHFRFDLAAGGVSLNPGFSYALFAVITPSDLTNQTIVPGEGSPIFDPEGAVFVSAAVDPPPFQLHQGSPTEFVDVSSGVTATQVATSRVIPVVPEPAAGLLLAVFAGVVALRRGRRRGG